MSTRQHLDPARTPWHITWGTYGTRLHGGERATVDRDHNQRGEAFIGRSPQREDMTSSLLNFDPILFSDDEREIIEYFLPSLCERGGWTYRIAAAEVDHVHLLCDIHPDTHGKQARALAKRWLGEELTEIWPLGRGATWWAEGGSTRAVRDDRYLNNVYNYILRQRHTPLPNL